MVRMVWIADVSSAVFLTFSIWGTANAMMMSMKPESGSRFKVRGSRSAGLRSVLGVVFMSCGFLNRLTAIEYRRFQIADGTRLMRHQMVQLWWRPLLVR